MKTLKRMLALALCAAALLTLPAFAAEPVLISAPPAASAPEEPEAPAVPAPVQVWGTVTRLENGALLVTNSDENDPYREIILHIGKDTAVVDATGTPMDPASLRDGDTVYAWVGPAMTMSLPPQAAARALVGKLPADFRAPAFYEITGPDRTIMPAIYPVPERTHVTLPVAGGETLTIPVSAQFRPYLTKNIVTVDDLVPGSQILVWRDSEDQIRQVLLLPYRYRGYLTTEDAGLAQVNGEMLSVPNKNVEGVTLLPVRAVAEALGFDVAWVPGSGAVVSQGEDLVFSVLPGGTEVILPEGGAWELSAACVLESGVTYLPVYDLAHLLNLYVYHT